VYRKEKLMIDNKECIYSEDHEADVDVNEVWCHAWEYGDGSIDVYEDIANTLNAERDVCAEHENGERFRPIRRCVTEEQYIEEVELTQRLHLEALEMTYLVKNTIKKKGYSNRHWYIISRSIMGALSHERMNG
tara:strand:- start:733 stop:1131 length:399 start_codon:yes stop_codon:yes gene_type:complete